MKEARFPEGGKSQVNCRLSQGRSATLLITGVNIGMSHMRHPNVNSAEGSGGTLNLERAGDCSIHLGDFFADPTSPTGQRYAVNSAAFRFIPIERMKDEGYEAFLPLVEKK